MTKSETVDSVARDLRAMSESAGSRLRFWETFLNARQCTDILEVGVFKGEFAEYLLSHCPSLATYHMLDPWRHLEDWNKPANRPDEVFEEYLALVQKRTAFAADRIRFHRGTTLEVIGQVADSSIDFAYIDGDHTLQGITIDLHHAWPKVRVGGWLAGDDFCPSIWQHNAKFEPTLVFPYAVYFAKAVGAPIFAVGHGQFLIWKTPAAGFAFHDLFRTYPEVGLRTQMLPRRGLLGRVFARLA